MLRVYFRSPRQTCAAAYFGSSRETPSSGWRGVAGAAGSAGANSTITASRTASAGECVPCRTSMREPWASTARADAEIVRDLLRRAAGDEPVKHLAFAEA